MPIITSSLNTPFTPTVTVFTVSVSGDTVSLHARGSETAPWTEVGPIFRFTVVDNPVSGTQYRIFSRSLASTIEVNG
jgi:hypothetical protein